MTNAATNTHAPTSAAARAAEHDVTAALVRGDPDALRTLYDQHADIVYGLVLRIVGDVTDAEAIVEHVFVQAWTEAAQLHASTTTGVDHAAGSVLSWLTKLARARALQVVRSQRAASRGSSSSSVLHDFASSVEASPLSLVATAEEREINLTVALRALPAPQRRAIELAYFAGFTHEQIAVALNEPLATIKTRIRVGMLKVKEMLGMLGQETAR
ncbi:MAG: sigma-70 family RNA polymerase sigma factor [Gemmatimonadaceae bacterium]|nr:sigma-70 family RNA polymerase sigma factor [Gemmatimonadaceae bacterium]